MVLATTATMAITGITHHTPEDSEMLALTRHTTRYRPVIPIKLTAKPASIQHATLPLWETGGGGKVGKIGVALAAWAPGTSQSSDERPALALLSRKLDYTTADPPKLRPGLVSARERRYSPFARNGPAQGHAFCSRPSPVTAPVSSF
ncbi:hypothetical protein Q7P36_010686 [Cladosporium allicinum]